METQRTFSSETELNRAKTLHLQKLLALCKLYTRYAETQPQNTGVKPLTLRIRELIAKQLPRKKKANHFLERNPVIRNGEYFSQFIELPFVLSGLRLILQQEQIPHNQELKRCQSQYFNSTHELLSRWLPLFRGDTLELVCYSPSVLKGMTEVGEKLQGLLEAIQTTQGYPLLGGMSSELLSPEAVNYMFQLDGGSNSLEDEVGGASAGAETVFAAEHNYDLAEIDMSLRVLEETVERIEYNHEQGTERILKEIRKINADKTSHVKKMKQALETAKKGKLLAKNVLILTGHGGQASVVGDSIGLTINVLEGVLEVYAGYLKGNPAMVLGGLFDISNAVMGQFIEMPESAEQLVLKGLGTISKQISELRLETHTRFDRLEHVLSRINKNIVNGLLDLSADMNSLKLLNEKIQQDISHVLNRLNDGLVELKSDTYLKTRMNAIRNCQDHGYPKIYPDQARQAELKNFFNVFRNWVRTVENSKILSPDWHHTDTVERLLEEVESYGIEYCVPKLVGFARDELALNFAAKPLNVVVWADAMMAFVEHGYRNSDVTYSDANLRAINDLVNMGKGFQELAHSLAGSEKLWQTLIDRLVAAYASEEKKLIATIERGINTYQHEFFKLIPLMEMAITGVFNAKTPMADKIYTDYDVMQKQSLKHSPVIHLTTPFFKELDTELYPDEAIASSDQCRKSLESLGVESFLEYYLFFVSHLPGQYTKPTPTAHQKFALTIAALGMDPGQWHKAPQAALSFAKLLHATDGHHSLYPLEWFEYHSQYLQEYMACADAVEREKIRTKYPKLSLEFCRAPLILVATYNSNLREPKVVSPVVRYKPACLVPLFGQSSTDYHFEYTAGELQISVKLLSAFLNIAFAGIFEQQPEVRDRIFALLANLSKPEPKAELRQGFKAWTDCELDINKIGRVALKQYWQRNLTELRLELDNLMYAKQTENIHPIVRAVERAIEHLNLVFHE